MTKLFFRDSSRGDQIDYPAGEAQITEHVASLPPNERLFQLQGIVKACEQGPRPWRDGDERCHCTHCNGCGRLYRSADIEAHRDVCLIRQLAQRVRRDD